MKKTLSLLLAFILCLSLCACGKSEAASMVEALISEIGEVSLDSESAIMKAENAYSSLSEKDKNSVDNYSVLMEARLAYDTIIDAKEQVDTKTEEALAAFEKYDVSNALKILDTISPITIEQKNKLEELYKEIESHCYEGTHFLTMEYVIGVESKSSFSYQGNEYTFSQYSKKESDYIISYTCLFGGDIFPTCPQQKYTGTYLNAYCNKADIQNDYSEYWYKWVPGSFGNEYPEWAYVDDLGNILAYQSEGTGTLWWVKLTIHRATIET